jgi:hypothetical protein
VDRFLEDVAVSSDSLAEVTEELAAFLMPHAAAAQKSGNSGM